MNRKLAILVGVLLICISVFAEDKIEAVNHTDLKDSEINDFVTNLVKAINANDQKALLPLLHPDCRKVLSKSEDVSLFVKFMLDYAIPATYKWKAGVLKENSVLLKINRFVVKPTVNIDIFWKAPTKEKPEHVDALSIMFIKQDSKLFVVSYINDYMKKKLKTSNKEKF